MIITTSWDDGHPLDHRLADRLNHYGLAGTFYIPRKSQLETLSEKSINDLSKHFEIGAHTMDHLALPTLRDDNAKHQIADSKAWVESVTGKPCPMFCPPLGKFNSRHATMIRLSGFTGFRTVEMLSTIPPRKRGSLIELATTIQSHPHARTAYLKNAIRRLRASAILDLIRLRDFESWPQRTAWYLQRAAETKGVFHLWGHSWEIDQYGQWQALESVLQQLQSFVNSGKAISLTNGELCDRFALPTHATKS
jgi:peptidoglycan-N-acetylglucosamine deacetylase